MKDTELVNLITRLSENEAMPMVADPGVIDRGIPARGSLGERYRTPSFRILRSVPQPIPRVRLHRASAPRCTLTITPCFRHTVRPS